MDYAIDMLETHKKNLEKHVKKINLMKTDMREASQKLHRITELKKAIKTLKSKNRKP